MDPNQYRTSSIESPANAVNRIVPDDANDLALFTSYIYIETAGDLHFVTTRGSEETVSYDRGYHPLQLKKVFATGTTATGIIGHNQ